MNIFSKVKSSASLNKNNALQAKVKISGTGSYVPSDLRLSSDIDRELGRKSGKTEQRTGVYSRPIANQDSSSSMAVAAALRALKDADMEANQIGLILSACAVPEQPIPAMAPLFQAGLGLSQSGIPAFDVNASCLSFVAAFDLAAQLIEAQRYKNVLIVSSEIASRALPWRSDPDTAAMFGDGAAAVIVSPSQRDGAGLVASHMETWSEGYRDCELPSGGTRFDFHKQPDAFASGAAFRMDGRAAYKLAAKVIQPFMDKLLAKAGWGIDDVDIVVPHQASRGALDHLVAKLKIPRAKIIDIIANHGNQIAASIPTALSIAMHEGRIKSGMKVLVVGTSAGFSVGGLCLVIE